MGSPLSLRPSSPNTSFRGTANLLTVNTQLFDAMTTNSLAASNIQARDPTYCATTPHPISLQLEKAGAFGTTAHSIIEKLIEGSKDIDVPPEFENVKKGFLEWKKQAELRSLRILSIEEPIYSNVHKYAGILAPVLLD